MQSGSIVLSVYAQKQMEAEIYENLTSHLNPKLSATGSTLSSKAKSHVSLVAI